MPIDIGESINSIADSFLKAPIVHSIAVNPIYTALMLTFVIILVIMFVFRDADTDESLLIMSLRGGFWIFIMLIGVLFLHNKVLGNEIIDNSANKAYNDTFNGGYSGIVREGEMPSGILSDSLVPVTINGSF